MNTNLRRIDLICKLLAPVFITIIMHFAGVIIATAVLALWNVLSFIVETVLINFVYKLEPNLATKAYRHKDESSEEESTTEQNDNSNLEREDNPDEEIVNDQEILVRPRIHKPKSSKQNAKRFAKRLKRKLFNLPKNFLTGWKIYFRQKIWLVGLSMACLYLTVLGFSGVTAGYFYTQGMTELYLGLAQGIAGIMGVGSTIVFPYLRRLTGTIRTGIIGISLQLFSLSFCVIGVFAPGNPTFSTPPPSAACLNPFLTQNTTIFNTHNISEFNTTISYANITANSTESTLFNTKFYTNTSITANLTKSTLFNTTKFYTNVTTNLTTSTPIPAYSSQYASLILMVTGVVTARFGLWLFDLSVVQIIQENVIESERGVVNGIMSSMNFFNDMLHFLLVTIFPNPSQFGYLTILSFLAIATAWILFFVYVLLHEREELYCGGCKKKTVEFVPIEHEESTEMDEAENLE